MKRNIRFTFLISPDERVAVQTLAQGMRRSQGDAIRIAVLRELERLGYARAQSGITNEYQHQA